MYRSVLALLFASVLLLSGCAVGQQTVPKEKSGQELAGQVPVRLFQQSICFQKTMLSMSRVVPK